MKRLAASLPCIALLSLLAPAPGADTPKDEPPQRVLANKAIKLTLYVPDVEKGYYRGVRFDWSGLVARVEYKKHTLFAEWKTPHKPDDPEGALGTAEEFGIQSPPGYKDAKPGETFLKIGVGELRKEKDEDYFFMTPYPIATTGTWKYTTTNTSAEFEQTLAAESGWGYRYVKRLRLDGEKPAFTIAHELHNTGKKRIDTDVYCHNFIIFDGDPIGPNYRIRFGFPARAPENHQLGDLAEVTDKGLAVRRELGDKTFQVRLDGLTGKAADNTFTVEHARSRLALRVVGDTPLSKFNVWSIKTALCPEPFVAVKLDPGESMKWSSRYEIAETDARKR
jgi:hypothetical protein